MDIETKIALVKRHPTAEIITEDDLRRLFENNDHPVAYDGFEPSGFAHLGSGLLRAIKLDDLIKAGIKFKFLIADIFALLNDKMGGDLDAIKEVGKYLVSVWEACGVDMSKVEIIWSSDVFKDPDYWGIVLKIIRNVTVNRLTRAVTIMGRSEGEVAMASRLFYPAMQCADIFYLNVDICQLGYDQRKANILARDIGEKIGFWKPVCVHHELLIGLQGAIKMGGYSYNRPDERQSKIKMSKSFPDTCIFVHDAPGEVERKIKNAFCPSKQVIENPILEILKFIIFRKLDKFDLERPEKFGGTVTYYNFEDLATAYRKGEIHPLDLKINVSNALNEILEPVRAYFKERPELLEVFKKQKITR
ncbi:MAG: tyrosine--tRNA ligase [Methanophagales archaeon]|nr:tyrosine--tRNA ligase [Methanophagales archaeon]